MKMRRARDAHRAFSLFIFLCYCASQSLIVSLQWLKTNKGGDKIKLNTLRTASYNRPVAKCAHSRNDLKCCLFCVTHFSRFDYNLVWILCSPSDIPPSAKCSVSNLARNFSIFLPWPSPIHLERMTNTIVGFFFSVAKLFVSLRFP